ncbi:hypothetical protein, partial [Burkholderia aenigmatica]|uniref:hypothetical protein n=1 Tax=Burkholderia aenigmatica TaxID=2015348 RepID=UPI001C531A56
CESGILMGVHPAGFLEGWVFGDFQSPRLSPDEPSIQPIEASHLAERIAFDKPSSQKNIPLSPIGETFWIYTPPHYPGVSRR